MDPHGVSRDDDGGQFVFVSVASIFMGVSWWHDGTRANDLTSDNRGLKVAWNWFARLYPSLATELLPHYSLLHPIYEEAGLNLICHLATLPGSS